MSRKARLILFLILGLVLAFFILFLPRQGFSADQNLMTPQEAIKYNDEAVVIAVIYFIFVFLNAGFFLLAKYNLKNLAQLNKNIFINFKKTKKLGKLRIVGETEPFTRIELQSILGTRLDWTTANFDGSFYFYVKPDIYTLNLEKFGFQKSATEPIEISGHSENEVKVKLKREEAIAVDSPLIAFFSANQKFWAMIFVLSLVCAYITYPYLGAYRILLILITSLMSLWICLNEQNSYLKIIEHSGKNIVNAKIEILNHKDEKLGEAKTNRQGKIKLVASKGFYKISALGRNARTFRVKENCEIVNLTLKI